MAFARMLHFFYIRHVAHDIYVSLFAYINKGMFAFGLCLLIIVKAARNDGGAVTYNQSKL